MTESAEMTRGRRLRSEILGLCWLTVGAFVLISLLSYSNADPSFNNNLKPTSIQNFGGMVGAHLADLLYQLLGLPALLLPIFLLFQGWRNLTLKPLGWRFYKLIALLVALFAMDGLLALKWQKVELLGQTISQAGGAIGRLLVDQLTPVFNLPGTAMILGIFLAVSLILVTHFSLVLFLDGLVMRFGAWLDRRRERRAALKADRRKGLAQKPEDGPMIAAPAPPPVKMNPKKKSRKKDKTKEQQETFDFIEASGTYHKPSLQLLDHEGEPPIPVDREALTMNARLLEKKLQDFGVAGEVVEVKPGPVVTMYEFAPAPGVKVSKISGLADDLTMALSAMSIRIVAPIPGRSVVGIEIPNKERQTIYLKEIFESEVFNKAGGKLPMALGKDIFGGIVVSDLSKMPHVLVAGSTGSGKSVSINTMILSLLYRATPDDVRLIMIDPKMLELSIYEGIPHLLLPVVTEAKKAALALNWAVREMERRYQLLADKSVRNIDGYNRKIAKEEAERLKNPPPEEPEPLFEDGDDGLPPMPPPPPEVELEHGHLPHIVVIVDELADLMMVAGRELEESIARLAQMARAAGIHLILATQRPSVDVITGLIKANFPTRISFKVFSRTDSRTILDSMGAEALLGMGDMLFLPPGTGALQRVHGAFVSELEVQRVVDFLEKQGKPEYDQQILKAPPATNGSVDEDEEYDDRWDDALALITNKGQASISMVQRHLRIGYNRAARMIEKMEAEGIVGPSDGSGKPREVLLPRHED